MWSNYQVVGKMGRRVYFVLKFDFMEIRVKIPDELAAEARTRGVRVELYVEELLAQQVTTNLVETKQPQTPEQTRAWLDALAQFSDKIPPLPETISREWIYQDHD